MDPQETSTESTNVKANCAALLTNACLTAKLYSDEQREIAQLEQSKEKIKRKNLKFDQCPQVLGKIRSSIADKQVVAKDTKSRLKYAENKLIKEVTGRLESGADITGILDISAFEQDQKTLLDAKIKPYIEQINEMRRRIDVIESQKLDKAENAEIIRDLIKITEESLRAEIERSNDIVKLECRKEIANLKDLEARLLRTASQKDEIMNDNIQELVEKNLCNYLGQKFLEQLLNNNPPKSTIYPTTEDNSIKSLQVRDTSTNSSRITKQDTSQRNRIRKSLYKMAKMRKELDEALSLCEATLKSGSVQNVFKNLDHIDCVTKSHKQILDFVNAPSGHYHLNTKSTSEKLEADGTHENLNTRSTTDDLDASIRADSLGTKSTSKGQGIENIPPQISLFSEDKRLSTALVTSLAEYTNKLYFSDLTQRVEELERKLQ